MRRRHQEHELVAADGHFEQAAFRGTERQRAEVEAALLHFHGDLPRRHPADVEGDLRMPLAEAPHERQQRVDRRFVGADEHAAATQVAQVAHHRLGLVGQTDEALPVVLQHLPRLGERAALRRAIDQLFPEVRFEAADRLAHGRLRPVHLGRRARKAALVRHGEEDTERLQVHNRALSYRNHYHFDF